MGPEHKEGPPTGVGGLFEDCWRVETLAGHLAGLDARGARVHTLGRAAHAGANGLDVGVPAAAGATVRVGNTVTEPWSLAADVANGSHGNSIQVLGIARVAARERSSDQKRSSGLAGEDANRERVHADMPEGGIRPLEAPMRATAERGAAEASRTHRSIEISHAGMAKTR